MKRVFKIIPCLFIILLVAACSKPTDDKDIQIKKTKIEIIEMDNNILEINVASPKYQSDKLEVWDFSSCKELQGNVRQLVLPNMHPQLYYTNDGYVYYEDEEDGWKKWLVGKDKTIISYDYDIITMKNQDGSLNEYCFDDDSGNLFSVKSQFSADEFVQTKGQALAFDEPHKAMDRIYKQNGKLYYQEGYFDELSDIEQKNEFLVKLGEKTLPIEAFNCDDQAFNFIRSGNMLIPIEARNDIEIENNKAFLEVDENVKIDNVEHFFGMPLMSVCVSEINDKQNLWLYDVPVAGIGETEKEAKISLPKQYTTDDIKKCYVGIIPSEKDPHDMCLITEFNDGTFYKTSYSDINSQQYKIAGVTYQMEKILTISENVDADHVKDVYVDSSSGSRFQIYLLMDDGYVYELKY